MKKLNHLLNLLSPSEFELFQVWLSSPWFNSDAKLGILAQHSYAQEKELSNQELFQKLYPGKTYNSQVLRNKESFLIRKAERFVAWNQLEKEPGHQSQLLGKMLVDRSDIKSFRKNLNQKAQQTWHRISSLQNLDFDQKIAELDYRLEQKTKRQDAEKGLNKLILEMDAYWITNRLKFSCEMLNRGLTLGQQSNMGMEQVLNFMPPNDNPKFLLAHLYRLVYFTLTYPEESKHYFQLKELVKELLHQIEAQETTEIFTFLQNYCIRRINAGQPDFLQELFSNYKLLLQSKLILIDGVLGEFDFKNILTVSIRLNEINWAHQFITDYSTLLPKQHQANAIQYNLARLFYAEKNLKQALKSLTTVEYTDVYYHLDSRILLTKIYYDLEDIESLFSSIQSFRQYLSRTRQISSTQQKLYLNFLSVIKRLGMLKDGSKVDLLKLEAFLKENPQTADISWLKERIANFKKNALL
ncbi:MAG: hypothetical protein K1X82_03955 [Bacteroidia bacterium]|nr:hypothetical protein [Bacteroidia bacterium]